MEVSKAKAVLGLLSKDGQLMRGLRELKKRLYQQPENISVFRNLGLVSRLLALIKEHTTNQVENVTDDKAAKEEEEALGKLQPEELQFADLERLLHKRQESSIDLGDREQQQQQDESNRLPTEKMRLLLDCITLLYVMSSDYKVKLQCEKESGVRVVVPLLRYGVADLSKRASQTLANLVQLKGRSMETFLRLGAPAAVVKLLQQHKEDHSLIKPVILAIKEMSCSGPACHAFLSARGLLELCNVGLPVPSLQIATLRAMAHYASVQHHTAIMQLLDGSKELVLMLRVWQDTRDNSEIHGLTLRLILQLIKCAVAIAHQCSTNTTAGAGTAVAIASTVSTSSGSSNLHYIRNRLVKALFSSKAVTALTAEIISSAPCVNENTVTSLCRLCDGSLELGPSAVAGGKPGVALAWLQVVEEGGVPALVNILQLTQDTAQQHDIDAASLDKLQHRILLAVQALENSYIIQDKVLKHCLAASILPALSQQFDAAFSTYQASKRPLAEDSVCVHKLTTTTSSDGSADTKDNSVSSNRRNMKRRYRSQCLRLQLSEAASDRASTSCPAREAGTSQQQHHNRSLSPTAYYPLAPISPPTSPNERPPLVYTPYSPPTSPQPSYSPTHFMPISCPTSPSSSPTHRSCYSPLKPGNNSYSAGTSSPSNASSYSPCHSPSNSPTRTSSYSLTSSPPGSPPSLSRYESTGVAASVNSDTCSPANVSSAPTLKSGLNNFSRSESQSSSTSESVNSMASKCLSRSVKRDRSSSNISTVSKKKKGKYNRDGSTREEIDNITDDVSDNCALNEEYSSNSGGQNSNNIEINSPNIVEEISSKNGKVKYMSNVTEKLSEKCANLIITDAHKRDQTNDMEVEEFNKLSAADGEFTSCLRKCEIIPIEHCGKLETNCAEQNASIENFVPDEGKETKLEQQALVEDNNMSTETSLQSSKPRESGVKFREFNHIKFRVGKRNKPATTSCSDTNTSSPVVSRDECSRTDKFVNSKVKPSKYSGAQAAADHGRSYKRTTAARSSITSSSSHPMPVNTATATLAAPEKKQQSWDDKLSDDESRGLAKLELIVRIITQVCLIKEAVVGVCLEFLPRIVMYLEHAQVPHPSAARMLHIISQNPCSIQPLLDAMFPAYVSVMLCESVFAAADDDDEDDAQYTIGHTTTDTNNTTDCNAISDSNTVTDSKSATTSNSAATRTNIANSDTTTASDSANNSNSETTSNSATATTSDSVGKVASVRCDQCALLATGGYTFLANMKRFFGHVHRYGSVEACNRLRPTASPFLRETCFLNLPHVTSCPSLLYNLLMHSGCLQDLFNVVSENNSEHPSSPRYLYATAALHALARTLQISSDMSMSQDCLLCLLTPAKDEDTESGISDDKPNTEAISQKKSESLHKKTDRKKSNMTTNSNGVRVAVKEGGYCRHCQPGKCIWAEKTGKDMLLKAVQNKSKSSRVIGREMESLSCEYSDEEDSKVEESCQNVNINLSNRESVCIDSNSEISVSETHTGPTQSSVSVSHDTPQENSYMNKVWAHRSVMCKASGVWAAMLGGGGWKEDTSSVVEVVDMGEQCLRAIVHHLYGCKCCALTALSLDAYVQLLHACHMYGLSDLQKFAARQIVNLCRTGDDIVYVYSSDAGRVQEDIITSILVRLITVNTVQTWKRAKWFHSISQSSYGNDLLHNLFTIVYQALDVNKNTCTCDNTHGLYMASKSVYGRLH